MNDTKINDMLYNLLEEIDYDLSKSYHVDTAEYPEDVEDLMRYLRHIARSHISGA